MQKVGKIADSRKSRTGNFVQLLMVCAAAQKHLEQAQLLTQIVVQLARNSATLFVLYVHDFSRELLQFQWSQLDDSLRFVQLRNFLPQFPVQVVDALRGVALFAHIPGNFCKTRKSSCRIAQRRDDYRGPKYRAILADSPAFIGESA